MTEQRIVALDMMGGDHGVSSTFSGTLIALRRFPHLTVVMVGDASVLEERMRVARLGRLQRRVTIQHASEQIHMHDSLDHALRKKKDSSMRVALNLVKTGQAHACVSAGNTGALMATARFVLKTLPAIDRPAIVAAFPTCVPGKLTRVLDLGANVTCSPEHLAQFALMGTILTREVTKQSSPTVGILNVGTEAIKGSPTTKAAHQILHCHPHINYQGYVEGGDIFTGNIDIVVCDGFVGNVLLKACEGEARLIYQYMRHAFSHSFFSRCVAVLAKPMLHTLRQQLDTGKHNGATLLGLKGIVIKSHGNANAVAFSHAIGEAMKTLDGDVLQKIESTMQAIHNDTHSEATHAV